jgi:hypothetical protein
MKTRRFAITVLGALAVAGLASFAVVDFASGQAQPRLAQAHATYHHLRGIDIASHRVGANSSDGLSTAQSHLGMLMSHATDLGTVGVGAAVEHLSSVPTSRGGSCFVATSANGAAGGSCLGTPSLFTDRPVAFIEQSDGGPAPGNISSLRIVGVVQPGVDGVQIQLSSGATESVSLSSTGTFEYEEALNTVHGGDLPAALLIHRGAATPTVVTISQ